jgi:hypothetical protein
VALDLVELECKNCGAPLDAGSISAELAVARCRHCQAVFALEQIKPPDPKPETDERSLPARIVTKPPHFEVSSKPGELNIVAGNSPDVGVMSMFLMACVAVAVFIAVSASSPIFTLAGILFVVVLVACAFKAIDMAVSKLLIHVGPDRLVARRKGTTEKLLGDFSADDIAQLYVTQYRTSGENARTLYRLHVVLADGRREQIFDRFDKMDQALFIEQEIEEFLGIRDQRVGDAGEVNR